MKTIKKYVFILFAVLAGVVSQGCQETIDTSDRYTFTQETLASYLQKHDTVYSEYYEVLSQVPVSRRSSSTVLQLISARGHYTMFAPTNEAIHNYLDSLWRKGIIDEPSWDGFRSEEDLDSIRKVIAYNSIINAGDNATDVGIYSSSFPGNKQEFDYPNLNERRLLLVIDKNKDYYINGITDTTNTILSGSLIDRRNRDIPAINGVLHQVHEVIAPSNQKVHDILMEFIETGSDLTGTAKLINVCGLGEELNKNLDLVYEEMVETEQIQDVQAPNYFRNVPMPDHKKHGFTVFAEKDEFWEATLGVNPKEISEEEFARKVKDWVVSQGFYPDATDDEDYSDPKNALYQFITYHIIPARIPLAKLVMHYNELGYEFDETRVDRRAGLTIPVYDYHTTIGERRLIKLYESKESPGICINRFPNLDNDREGTNRELGCDDDKQGFLINEDELREVVNGYIYPISPLGGSGPAALAYDNSTRENLQKERIRFDVSTFFPELYTNDIKSEPNERSTSTQANDKLWGFPVDKKYKYLANLSCEDDTYFCYIPGRDAGYANYQADEFNVVGSYDFTITLPPVPKRGVYEIRFAIQNRSQERGMCQVYFGTDPKRLPAMGIPLDLRINGKEYLTGWEEDKTRQTDYNTNIDKRMRNLGYMKAAKCYDAEGKAARDQNFLMRRIIVRQELDANKTYYIRFKTVLENRTKQFVLDYVEYCAKEVYDNPETPEDIW